MGFSEHQQLRKIGFYLKGFLQRKIVPDSFARRNLDRKLAALNGPHREEISRRVSYYHQLNTPFDLPTQACSPSEITFGKKNTYVIDYHQLLRHFPASIKTAQRFGDITDVSDYPCFVKTRPLYQANENSILLRFNSIRHFRPISDPIPFRKKNDTLVWRGHVSKKHRIAFFEKYFDHPSCDIGRTNTQNNPSLSQWNKPFLSIAQQLQHKFILSIEGNDVATNLKWIAQSNSLCFMTRPKFESWFMEGTLKGGEHYVELKDDYSDLQEKLDHYLANPSEAEAIITNFQSYHSRFTNSKIEEIIGILVVKKYLNLSGQS